MSVGPLGVLGSLAASPLAQAPATQTACNTTRRENMPNPRTI